MPTCCARSAAASIVERAVIHAAAPPELHLPDLPEVEVSLGAAPPVKPRAGLRMRLRELLGAYLPLLLMALLALGTWWLVKNTPRPMAGGEGVPLRHDP